MENNNQGKKSILFLAVTNKPDTEDRVYSDFVLEQCKKALDADINIRLEYDVSNFVRHDMMDSSSLEDHIISVIKSADYYIILIDCFDGSYCANVWFELGILAITSQKPLLLIAQQGKHEDYPFYIRNHANVLDFPVVSLKKKGSGYAVDVEKIDVEQMTTFNDKFVKRFKKCNNSPFERFSDSFHLKLSGYRNLRELEEKIAEIVNNSQMAEYIDGEENAFNALRDAVSTAGFSLRTTRFANESIIHSGINSSGNDGVEKSHKEFMEAIYEASKRIAENKKMNKYPNAFYRCDRIICNNSPEKWIDIYSALLHGSDLMKVYIRKSDYSINFEIVIIDEKIAFIHFYQSSRAEKKDDTVEHNNGDTQKIKSTLKITDPGVCVELCKVFDRLHHRDFDRDCCDLSRTLLGVEKDNYVSGSNDNCGFFIVNNYNKNQKKDAIFKLIEKALKNWNFPKDKNNEDKINMAAGYIKVNASAGNYKFNRNVFYKNMGFSTEEIDSIEKKL